MSSRFILPFADVGSGIKPSSGAKLFFFETDGVTPKNTFSDQLSTPTANTNPVIANSNGVFGDIFITGEYKVTLQDKNGSQIFGLATVSEFATTGDSAFTKNFLTLEGGTSSTSAIENESLQAGDAVNVAELTDSDGGGSMFDVVLASTVTIDPENGIFASTGVPGPTPPALALVQRKSGELNVSIPDDFTTLQGAVDYYQAAATHAEGTINLVIKDGHLLTVGLNCRHDNFSKFRITSELGNDVKLDPAFVGADTSDVPLGILGETPRQPLLFGYDATLPELYCIIDMEGLYGTGIQLAESNCVVNDGSGVINAGFRGIQVHGRANIYGAIFDGAEGSGIRLQQAASCNARNATANDCCKTEDLSNSAVYVSRSSILEFRAGSAQNSGAKGLISRRSIVTADDANFDNASDFGVLAEAEAKVSFTSGSAQNTTGTSIRASANGSIYAVGATTSTAGGADNFAVDVGGVITVAGSNTIEGVAGSEAQTILESNVAYTNAFDGDNGMIFFDGGNGTFKITSNADGISQRFADGRMVTYVSVTVDTGTVASGNFSAQITMPTQPDTFITVDTSSMDVIGRAALSGGGSRVCVDNYYRPSLMTGNAWRIRNTGQELDGAGSGFNCLSINVSLTTFGTWR